VLAALVAGPDGLFANDGESRRCLLAAARKQFNTTNGTKPCEAMLMPANATKERHTHTQREKYPCLSDGLCCANRCESNEPSVDVINSDLQSILS
jgi:hypothetical protein